MTRSIPSKQLALVAVVVLALVGAMAVWLWDNGPPAQVQAADSGTSSEAASPPRPAAAASEAPAGGVPDVAPPAREWIEGYYGGNLYAHVQALREARQPGSFAAAKEMLLPCLSFRLSEERAALSQASAQGRPNYAARVQAQQVLAARCSGITDDMHFALLHPLPGDEDGQRYQGAERRLQERSTKAELTEAVGEMARQGHMLDVLRQVTAISPHWQGQAWTGSAEEYALALTVADYRVQSLPGRERDDLRLLAHCMAYEICDYDVASPIRKLPAARQAHVLQLAAEMEAALREGRYEAFVNRPGP